jgi:two-component system chemotaxis response regulator CheY
MKRVLVVDDSKTVRSYHKDILKRAGYSVDEAENGMEALEKVIDLDYSLFLVDINMPIMDGYSFVEELRKNKKYNLTPVIMISTEAEDTDKMKAFEAGSNVYYIKPVKPDILLSSSKILIT